MRSVYLAAIAATAVMLTAAPATACCWNFEVPAANYVIEAPVAPINPFFVVNEGPIFTGPGIYTDHNIWVPSVARPARWNGVYVDGLPFVPYAHPHRYVRSSHAWHCRCGRGYAHAAHAAYGYGAYGYEPARAYVIGVPPYGY